MQDPALSAFGSPARHEAISRIIRRFSTNHQDVREVVLAGLDLSGVRRVLDLGCGFGFMTEAIASRAAPDAELIGIDAWPGNEGPYLSRIAGTGRRGRFVCQRLGSRLDWPDASFDLVVASYALYFFPAVLPEVARVLRPEGLFVALTHTRSSCEQLLRVVGLPGSGSPLLALIEGFCAENAEALLAPWFGQAQRVDYRNALAFDAAHLADLLEYVRFKLPLLVSGAGAEDELPAGLRAGLRAAVARGNPLLLDKNDAAFRCWRPRCR